MIAVLMIAGRNNVTRKKLVPHSALFNNTASKSARGISIRSFPPDNINVFTTIPKEIVSVIQALIILFLAVRFLDERYGVLERIKLRMSKNEVTK